MGKIFVLSVTDHEEYILSRIMEIIATEPGFDHTVSSHPCNILVFPGLELRLKERTVHRKVNSELDLLLDEGDVDAILMGKKTKYPDAAIRLTEQMAQEFISDLFSTLRERMLDLQYCKVVFVGGGAILLKRQIETSGKVGTPFFVPKINANADGYEYLYRIETAGR